MNKYLKYLIIAVVFLLVLAFTGKRLGWFGEGSAVKVAAEKVTRKTILETVSANGKIQPEVEVKISPDVSGEVVELFVKEGDSVRAGDILAKIKPDIYASTVDKMTAAVNGAKAALANDSARLVQVKARYLEAEISFRRIKKLWEEKAVSDADYENSKTQFEVAKAEVEASQQAVKGSSFNIKSAEASLKEANENFSKTTIKAPVSGTVYQLSVEKGDRVVGTSMMAGTEMMRIADLREMEVSVEVNENDIIRVHLNDTASIEVDAYLGEKFKGIVTEIANAAKTAGMDADQVTNFIVKIKILNTPPLATVQGIKNHPYGESLFRPGMTATSDIHTGTATGVLAVPIQAVTTRDPDFFEEEKNGKGKQKHKITGESKTGSEKLKKENPEECIFVFDNGTAIPVKVKTGMQDNDYIQILSGIGENQEVITAPYTAISRLLKNKSKVEKVDKDELWGEKEKDKER